MKLDLMGNVVKTDKLDFENIEICNGTIFITEADNVIEVSPFKNIKLHYNTFVLTKEAIKWEYIRCCLKLAWEKLKE